MALGPASRQERQVLLDELVRLGTDEDLWERIGEKHGVRIDTMKREFADPDGTVGNSINRLRGAGVVPAPASRVAAFLMVPENRPNWDSMTSCGREVVRFAEDGSDALIYFALRGKFPVTARDVLVRGLRRDRADGTRLIAYRSVVDDERCPEERGYVRAELLESGFILEPIWDDDGTSSECMVTYVAQLDIKGWVPDFLQYAFRSFQPLRVARIALEMTKLGPFPPDEHKFGHAHKTSLAVPNGTSHGNGTSIGNGHGNGNGNGHVVPSGAAPLSARSTRSATRSLRSGFAADDPAPDEFLDAVNDDFPMASPFPPASASVAADDLTRLEDVASTVVQLSQLTNVIVHRIQVLEATVLTEQSMQERLIKRQRDYQVHVRGKIRDNTAKVEALAERLAQLEGKAGVSDPGTGIGPGMSPRRAAGRQAGPRVGIALRDTQLDLGQEASSPADQSRDHGILIPGSNMRVSIATAAAGAGFLFVWPVVTFAIGRYFRRKHR